MKRFLVIGTIIILALIMLVGCQQVEFELSFISDGEVIHSIKTTGAETIRMPNDPIKEGYTFDGWYWDKDTWQKPFTASSLLNEPLRSDMSVYAKWTSDEVANQSYTLSFNTMGGSVIDAQSVAYNTVAQKPIDPIKNGFIFSGWYTEADCQTKWDFSKDKVVQSITLYAKWVESADSSACEIIEFVGGTINNKEITMEIPYDQETVVISNLITVSTNATYSVYTDIFGIDQIVSGTVAPSEGENVYYILVVSSNGSAKAQYTLKINRALSPKISVAVSVNGKEYTCEIDRGEAVEEPQAPSKDGYYFVGWYVNGGEISFPYIPSDDVVITAKWLSHNEASSVTFGVDENAIFNGSQNSFIVINGSPLSSVIDNLPSASKEKYDFKGWQDENGNEITIDTVINQNTTFTPVWEEIIYCIDSTTNHIWQEYAQDATCTEPGKSGTICTRCNYQISEDTQDALGHICDENTAYTLEISNNIPLKVYNCQRCGNDVREAYKTIGDMFNEPKLEYGNIYGKGNLPNLIDGNFDNPTQGSVAPVGTITIKVTAKEPVFVDTIVVSGIGNMAYYLYVTYEGGQDKVLIGMGNTGIDTLFEINGVITEYEITTLTASQGSEYINEIAPCKKIAHESGEHCIIKEVGLDSTKSKLTLTKTCSLCDYKEMQILDNITLNSFGNPTNPSGGAFGMSNAANVVDGVFLAERIGSVAPNGKNCILGLESKEKQTYVDYFILYGYGTGSFSVRVTYADKSTEVVGTEGLIYDAQGSLSVFEVGAEVKKIEVIFPNSSGLDIIYELAACTVKE